MFCGLPIDEDNESEKTQDRLESWCKTILEESNQWYNVHWLKYLSITFTGQLHCKIQDCFILEAYKTHSICLLWKDMQFTGSPAMMLTSTGVITMATIRSPIGCGVDSRVAWNSASTQLLTYNRDIKNGFSTWTLFRLQSILWHLGKGASCRQSQPLNDNCQARMHGSTQFDFDSRGKVNFNKAAWTTLRPKSKEPWAQSFYRDSSSRLLLCQ